MRSRKRAYPDYITRREHEEFARRMDTENQRLKDENERQNKRITIAEKSLNEFNKLTLEIQRIAASIQQMTEEMSKQGKRLENIESKPGKRWETLIGGILGAIAGAIGTAIVAIVAGAIHRQGIGGAQ